MNLQSSYKDVGNSTFFVELKIPAEELDIQFHNLVKKYSANVNLPGFRKGKVPPDMVEKRFSGELGQSVLEEIVPKAIQEALKTHSLETIGPADLDKDHPPLKYEKGKPLSLKIILNKKPACEIKSYEGLSIVKSKYIVGNEDIEENKKRILDSLGKSVEVDGNPSDGDIIHLDLIFKNEELKEFNLENQVVMFDKNGKNAYPEYLNPLYEIICKMKKEESQEIIDFDFPPDLKEEKLKGKKESFSIKVNRVSRFQAAELNSETFERLQVKDEVELMGRIKQDMEEHAQDQAEKQSYDEAISSLKKNTIFEIPEIAIGYLQSSWNQLAEDLKMKGQKNVPEAPPESWLNENRSKAREKIETDLIITKVKEEQNIEVGEEELENKVKEMARLFKRDLKDYRKELIRSGGFMELKRQLGYHKTLRWILEKCQVTEEKQYPFSKLNELQKKSK